MHNTGHIYYEQQTDNPLMVGILDSKITTDTREWTETTDMTHLHPPSSCIKQNRRKHERYNQLASNRCAGLPCTYQETSLQDHKKRLSRNTVIF